MKHICLAEAPLSMGAELFAELYMKEYWKYLRMPALFCLSFFCTQLLGQEPCLQREFRDTVLIMAWNVENFFDFRSDGASDSEEEFSATGARRWSARRFYTKCGAVAKTILWASDRLGRPPDAVVFEEVENAFVLHQLLRQTVLRKLDYGIVHYDSPDPRGIDVAMIYRKDRLALLDSRPVRVGRDRNFLTRDILLSCFRTDKGDSLAVMGCHFPSKYGGGESDWKREAAVAGLVALRDSLARSGWGNHICMGDFNDTPESAVFLPLRSGNIALRRTDDAEDAESCYGTEPSGAVRTHGGIGLKRNIEGSIRFNGEWQLIDLAFESDSLMGRCRFEVLRPPFLTTGDAAHSGEKPLRTYTGPRYTGGVSDHYPIAVSIFIP